MRDEKPPEVSHDSAAPIPRSRYQEMLDADEIRRATRRDPLNIERVALPDGLTIEEIRSEDGDRV